LMRRQETTDGRWIPAGMQGCDLWDVIYGHVNRSYLLTDSL